MSPAAVVAVLLLALVQVSGAQNPTPAAATHVCPIPTFTALTPLEPQLWNLTEPSQRVMWFEATQMWTPVAPANLTISNFTTNVGGQVLEVTSTCATDYRIRGWVPAADPFNSTTTVVQLTACVGSDTPTATPATAAANNAPVCSLYAVDMAFCGEDGLVTDSDSALLILGCSEAVVGFCSPAVDQCVTISGPANATVSHVDAVDGQDSYFHLVVTWESSYLGPVEVAVGCALTDGLKQGLWEAVPPITFTVNPQVPVRASAYKIGNLVMDASHMTGRR